MHTLRARYLPSMPVSSEYALVTINQRPVVHMDFNQVL